MRAYLPFVLKSFPVGGNLGWFQLVAGHVFRERHFGAYLVGQLSRHHQTHQRPQPGQLARTKTPFAGYQVVVATHLALPHHGVLHLPVAFDVVG